MKSKWRGAVATAFSIFVAVGCNSILENKPATLVDDEAGTEPVPSGTATGTPTPVPPPTDTGTPPPVPPPMPPDSTGACPNNWHMCAGSCVSNADPMYGCGAATCTPCNLPHAAASCAGGACIVATCDTGFANCNMNPTDGCETDLSKPASCGGCGVACPAAMPLCQAAGGSFACTNGCTAATPLLCSGACVDPLTSTSNCGACGHKCPDVMNGTATCAAGACGFTCRAGSHACTDHCAADTDVTQCGAACTPCPVVANATSACTGGACSFTCKAGFHVCAGTECDADTDVHHCGAACTDCPTGPNGAPACTAGACSFACSPGFADCNMNVADGCEVNLKTDPAHCGACATVCPMGQVCKSGVCGAP